MEKSLFIITSKKNSSNTVEKILVIIKGKRCKYHFFKSTDDIENIKFHNKRTGEIISLYELQRIEFRTLWISKFKTLQLDIFKGVSEMIKKKTDKILVNISECYQWTILLNDVYINSNGRVDSQLRSPHNSLLIGN
jgi:hypothetical protein